MIKANIAREYPHHFAKSVSTNKSLFVADYTAQTQSWRGTEMFAGTPPTDSCHYFSLQNDAHIQIVGIVFDPNKSFVRPDGNALSQCECAVFPETSGTDSWIFFAELKYYCGSKDEAIENTLKKAINQLMATRTYYISKGIFSKNNICYLLASLPMQAEPFSQFALDPADLQQLKKTDNIVLRLQNHAEIQDDKIINV